MGDDGDDDDGAAVANSLKNYYYCCCYYYSYCCMHSAYYWPQSGCYLSFVEHSIGGWFCCGCFVVGSIAAAAVDALGVGQYDYDCYYCD